MEWQLLVTDHRGSTFAFASVSAPFAATLLSSERRRTYKMAVLPAGDSNLAGRSFAVGLIFQQRINLPFSNL